MSKQIAVDAHTVHVEKVPEHEDLVSRMNTLDPPVTPEEEKRVKRKIDLRLPPFLLILYMFTWLDRGALGTCLMSHPTLIYSQFHRQCSIDGHQDRLETLRSTVQSRRQHVLRGHMRGRLVHQHRHALHSTQPIPCRRNGESATKRQLHGSRTLTLHIRSSGALWLRSKPLREALLAYTPFASSWASSRRHSSPVHHT